MKNWMAVISGLVLAVGLGFSNSAQAEAGFAPTQQPIGYGVARISVGVSVAPRQTIYPQPIPMPMPMPVCGGYNPCGGGQWYPMPQAYGSHGFAGGGFGYGFGGGYGQGRMWSRCGHGKCRRFKRCCYRRGFKSFSLGIRVGGFGLAIRKVSF